MNDLSAFLFPGQGTQRPGMAEHLQRVHPPARAMFSRASDILGFDLGAVCRRGPEATLRATDVAQPALFVSGCAYAAFLQDQGVRAAAAAGHSVGELCALVVAGGLSFEAGVALVAARGRLMARAGQGSMASIVGLDRARVAALVAEAGGRRSDERAVVAVVNAADDVVVSGAPRAVEWVATAARGRSGVTVNRLRVSGAFHSPLMAAVALEWTEHVYAAPLAELQVPVALNATGRLALSTADVRQAVATHLTAPVLWADCMAALASAGVSRGVECGDSRALRRINSRLGFDTVAARSPLDLARLAGTPGAAPTPVGAG